MQKEAQDIRSLLVSALVWRPQIFAFLSPKNWENVVVVLQQKLFYPKSMFNFVFQYFFSFSVGNKYFFLITVHLEPEV